MGKVIRCRRCLRKMKSKKELDPKYNMCYDCVDEKIEGIDL